VTEPHTASEPSGQELVIVGMAGRRNGPPLSMRYDDDDPLQQLMPKYTSELGEEVGADGSDINPTKKNIRPFYWSLKNIGAVFVCCRSLRSLPRSTQPGHLSVGRYNEYQRKLGRN